MKPEHLEKIKSMVSDPDTAVAIISHSNPDGDALGSALALRGFFENMGVSKLKVVMPNNFPGFLRWMPWSDEIIVGTKNPSAAASALLDANIVFCLDFNSISRVDKLKTPLTNSKALKVLIDHHPQSEEGFDVYYTDIGASSTAELVYELFGLLKMENMVSLPVAQCLYTGIITDTGSLSYSNNKARTYHIMGKLVEAGVDAENLQRLIYNTFSENRLRLLGYSLSEKLVVLPKNKAAYISLSRDELKRFSYRVGDTEGIVNYPLSIMGVDLAAIFIQYNDHVKISFRSSGAVDVNEFARKHFNGGGHKNASGGKSFETLENTIKKFENFLAETNK